MKVLVTGGAGFTGEAVLRALAKRGDSVFALYRPDGTKPPDLAGVTPIAQDLVAPLGTALPEDD